MQITILVALTGVTALLLLLMFLGNPGVDSEMYAIVPSLHVAAMAIYFAMPVWAALTVAPSIVSASSFLIGNWPNRMYKQYALVSLLGVMQILFVIWAIIAGPFL